MQQYVKSKLICHSAFILPNQKAIMMYKLINNTLVKKFTMLLVVLYSCTVPAVCSMKFTFI